MNRRTQLVIAISVFLSGMPLAGESAQIIPDLTSRGQTITTGVSLAVNPLIPSTNDGNITITTTPPSTTTGNISSPTNSVGIDGTPSRIDGASISPTTTPTTTGIPAVTVTGTPTSVPEPSSLLLVGAGLIGLAGIRRRLSWIHGKD